MDTLVNRFKSFNDLCNDYKLATSFFSIPEISSSSEEWFKSLTTDGKSTKLSTDFRLEANALFKSKQFSKAFDKMKECLRYARTDDADDPLNTGTGCSLAVAFKNRATIHYYDKKYKECIFDIEMTIESGYPTELQHNLYLTKGQAYIMDLRQVKGIECFEKALRLFENNCSTEPGKKEAFAKQVRLTIEATKKKARDLIAVPVLNQVANIKVFERLPCKCKNDKELFCDNVYCALYDSVAIHYSKTKGRGLFLKRRVKKGSAIFMDKSCASLVGRILSSDRCHGCMRDLTTSFIPCRCCTEVFYCTTLCFEEAWAKYHRFECGLVGHLRSLKNFARMAYRVFVQSSPSDIIGVLETLGKSVEQLKAGHEVNENINHPMEGFKNGTYQVNYYGLFHLDAGTRTHDLEYNRKALEICLKLLRLYESKCNSLGVSDNWDLNLVRLNGAVMSTERRALQLAILFHHYKQSVNHNVVKLLSKWDSGNTVEDMEEHTSGVGSARMFPIGCLINHSHRPNVVEHFEENGVYCFYKTIVDMEVGEQLTIDYDRGCDFSQGTTLTFACQCRLCQVLPGVTDEDLCFAAKYIFCEGCCEILPESCEQVACSDCWTSGSDFWSDVFQVYHKGLKLARKGRNEAAIGAFKSCLRLRSKISETGFSSLQVMVWACLALLYKKTGANDHVIEYTTLVLCAFDNHGRIGSFRVVGVAARLLAEAISLEMQRWKNNQKKVSELGKQLEEALKRDASGYDFSVMHDGFGRGGLASVMGAEAYAEFQNLGLED